MGLTDVFQDIQKKFSFTKSVEISGIKFEIGMLTFEQELKTESFSQAETDPLAYYNEVRRYTLSNAIRSINGEAIPAVVEVKNGDSTDKIQGTLYMKDILSKMPVKIVEQLYDVYVDFKDEFEGILEKDIKYNWFKTPEQRETERKKKTEENKNETEKSEAEKSEEPPIKFTEIPKPAEDEKE